MYRDRGQEYKIVFSAYGAMLRALMPQNAREAQVSQRQKTARVRLEGGGNREGSMRDEEGWARRDGGEANRKNRERRSYVRKNRKRRRTEERRGAERRVARSNETR